jgi:hypothetical protein
MQLKGVEKATLLFMPFRILLNMYLKYLFLYIDIGGSSYIQYNEIKL